MSASPPTTSRAQRWVVTALFAAPVGLGTIATLALASTRPLGLRPLVRQGFELGVEWLWFFALSLTLIHVVRSRRGWRPGRLRSAAAHGALAFVGATAIAAVIQLNDGAAFGARLGRAKPSPLAFMTGLAAPGTWLADLIFDGLVSAPSTAQVFAELSAEGTSAGAAARDVDGRSIVLVTHRLMNASLVRLDAQGELDPSFFAGAALFRVAHDVIPLTADALLVGTADGLMRVTRGRAPERVDLPPATRAVLPATDEPLAFLRPLRSPRGGLWLALAYDVITARHAAVPLAVRLDHDLQVQAALGQDKLPDALRVVTGVEDSARVVPMAVSDEGRLALEASRRDAGRVLVVSPAGELERVLTLDLLAHQPVTAARFIGEDRLEVLHVDWQDRDGAREPLLVATRFDRASERATEVQTSLSMRGLVGVSPGTFADGSVLIATSGGLVFRGPDLEPMPERDRRLREDPCAAVLEHASPTVDLDDGVVVRVDRTFLPDPGGGAPIAPLLQVRRDGSVNEAWNRRLIARRCR